MEDLAVILVSVVLGVLIVHVPRRLWRSRRVRASVATAVTSAGNGIVYAIGCIAIASLLCWGIGPTLVTLVVGGAAMEVESHIPWSKLGSGLVLILFAAWVIAIVRGLLGPLVTWLRQRRQRQHPS